MRRGRAMPGKSTVRRGKSGISKAHRVGTRVALSLPPRLQPLIQLRLMLLEVADAGGLEEPVADERPPFLGVSAVLLLSEGSSGLPVAPEGVVPLREGAAPARRARGE